jgi:hypothetical protein
LVDDKSFHNARRRLCEIGFFERADDLKRPIPCSPDLFRASTSWMHYTPSDQEVKRLERRKRRRQAMVTRGQERRRNFIRSCGEGKTK